MKKIITTILFLEAVAVTLMAIMAFVLFEPVVTLSATATDEFTIRQQIGDEISFLVAAADVAMAGSIGGVTGGHATGTTYAVVQTNSTNGYTMDISFENDPSMLGEVSGSTALKDYAEATPGTPDFGFVASTSAVFAYTVAAADSSHLDSSFLDNGSVCGTGAGFTADACWKGPSTSDFRIIDSPDPALTGATTTLTFVVDVPSNPVPALEQDYYTATATLTATTQ